MEELFNDKSSKDIITKVRNKDKKIYEFEEIVKKYFCEEIKAIDEEQLKVLKCIYTLRNKSSHPSFFAEEHIFSPNAEDVRMSIRNAIELILSQKPILGKNALNYIKQDIDSELVPSDYEEFSKYIESKGYIENANYNLKRNLFILSLKAFLLKDDMDNSFMSKSFNLIKYILRNDNDVFIKEFEKIRTIIERLPNKDLNFNRFIKLLLEAEQFRDFLKIESIRIKLKSFLSKEVLDYSTLLFKFNFYREVDIDESKISEDFISLIKKGLINSHSFIDKINPNTQRILLKAIFEEIPNLYGYKETSEFVYRASIFLNWISEKEEFQKLLEAIKENSKNRRYNQILDAEQKLENVLEIFGNIPSKILEENEILINELLEYLRKNHQFEEDEITEIKKLIESKINHE